MKFLILGCSGMAGHMIGLYLKEKGQQVLGVSRKEIPYINCLSMDVTNVAPLQELIMEGSFDVIVNAIGILNDSAENDKQNAILLNSYLPHFLTSVTKNLKTRIFHMSTDCVFRGNTGPYFENSFPDGRSFYDRTKALGEINDNKNLTLRNSIIGPDLNKEGIGLFNWFAQQRGVIYGYENVLWNGITTLELAKAILLAAESDVTGLVNLTPKKPISKAGLLRLVNDIIFDKRVTVKSNFDIKLDKSLTRSNFNFDYVVSDYKDQMVDLKEWLINHKDLYNHYWS